MTAQSSSIFGEGSSCFHKEALDRDILVMLQAWNW